MSKANVYQVLGEADFTPYDDNGRASRIWSGWTRGAVRDHLVLFMRCNFRNKTSVKYRQCGRGCAKQTEVTKIRGEPSGVTLLVPWDREMSEHG